jgi:GNAT superfamily N-acetyltransferase
MARVLRDSIRQLCVEDHGGAERPLQEWLANKTDESVRLWLKNPANVLLVADVGGVLAAVGGVQRDGHVILNYVAPGFRLRGISKGMMAELERRALQLGIDALTLESTVTARRFYLALGFRDMGSPGEKHRLRNYPMSKVVR